MDTIEQTVQNKAYELGYEKCGIIPINLMDEYAAKFNERIEKVPKSKLFYQTQQRLANPKEIYPWAKSVVVLAVPYGKYKVPDILNGLIAKAYLMSPTECISFLTTFAGRNLSQEPLSKSFENCIYGCDICQDACPMNKGKWKGEEEFPGLAELAPSLMPENILNMEEDFYRENVQPKFFYLSPEELWKWKVDALCYMRNNYKESYKLLIINACNNENNKVREMACSICKELCLQ